MGLFGNLMDDLFSSPNGTEESAVEAAWNTREPNIYPGIGNDGFQILDSYREAYPPVAFYYLLFGHMVGTSPHVGVLRVPDPAYGGADGWSVSANGFLPCGRLVCHHGAPIGDPNDFTDSPYDYYTNYKNQFAEVIPVYRGNILCWHGGLGYFGGPSQYNGWATYDDSVNNPGDLDTDDVLAFLNVVKTHIDTGVSPIIFTTIAVGIGMGLSYGSHWDYGRKPRRKSDIHGQVARSLLCSELPRNWR